MSDTKACKTEMNILQPLNPKKLSTLKEVLETFACDPPEEGEEKIIEEKVDERKQGSMAYGSSVYTLMPRANTYALGAQALRDSFKLFEIPDIHTYAQDGSKIVRPLTFRENLIACLEDFNTEKDCNGNERTEDDRLRLFDRWLDSCTGIAYKANSTKFKIIPQCEELIEINPDFNQPYLDISYGALSGDELDSGRGKYNKWLTKEEVLGHPGWLAAVEEDKVLLKNYIEFIFALLKKKNRGDSCMGFEVTQNKEKDKLWALFVGNLDGSSNAYGNSNLNNYGSFLRATPVVAKNFSIGNRGGK